jgi:hypothetical protein
VFVVAAPELVGDLRRNSAFGRVGLDVFDHLDFGLAETPDQLAGLVRWGAAVTGGLDRPTRSSASSRKGANSVMQASARLPDGNAAETPGDADGAAPFACGTGEAWLAGASACPGSGAGKAACAKTCPASTIATAKVDATIRRRSIKGVSPSRTMESEMSAARKRDLR